MNKTNTILGGCWREKVVSDFGIGHSKSHFQAPENAKSAHFQVPENGTLSARIVPCLKNLPKKLQKNVTFPSVFLNLPLPLFIIPHVSLDGHRSLSLIKHSCFEEMENSFYFPLCPNHLVQIVTFCSDCFHCFSINLLLPSLIWIILNYPSVSQRHSHNRQKVNN